MSIDRKELAWFNGLSSGGIDALYTAIREMRHSNDGLLINVGNLAHTALVRFMLLKERMAP